MEFLRSVAKVFASKLDGVQKLDEYVFVFPNRRSLKFFQKYLGEEYGKLYDKPLISPILKTVNDFFSQLSDLDKVDSVEALYILYKHYIKLRFPTLDMNKAYEKESFDDFVYWGDMILRDFDDIDKYLVDSGQLFTNIKDLKEIEGDLSFLSKEQIKAIEGFWGNFYIGGTSEKKEMFFSLWEIMFELYNRFRNELRLKGKGYEGMIYRIVADNIANSKIDSKVVFIGLNAPNNCERKVMDFLMNKGKADFYWDFYGNLLTRDDNSASLIIKKCVERYKSEYELPGQEDTGYPQNIYIKGVPSGVGQAFVISDILKNIPVENSIKTCIQLPNEKLLIPVVNSVPQKFSQVNVTMGYPLSDTSLISFMNIVSDLQRDIRKENGAYCFYHKDISLLLDHRFVLKNYSEEAKEIKRKIIEGNLVFIAFESEIIKELQSPLLRKVFIPAINVANVIDYQIDILKELESDADMLEKEFLYQYYLRITSLRELDIPMEVRTYFKLLSRLTSGVTVPFKGEPLAGLQIMGSLEIRALDFDNLIIASSNEGTFPTAPVNNTLIPFNLRFGFGLPTYELQDSIAAYHFYRSISRVKNLYLIYDTRTEGLTTGEVTRYVKQLKYHFNIPLNEEIVSYKIPTKTLVVQEIKKDKDILEKIRNKRFSASAINKYIECPLKFYFEAIEGVRDDDEVSENIESDVFGDIYHGVMEQIYKPYTNKEVTKSIIDNLIKSDTIANLIEKTFKDKRKIDVIKGQNLIIEALLKKYVELTLIQDKKKTPFKYIKGEGAFYKNLEFNEADVAKFIGFIDRQDLVNGILNIIDYKTGSVEPLPKEIALEELFIKDNEGKYKILMQLYIYAYLADIKNPTQLVIYPVRKIIDTEPYSMMIDVEKLERFKELLKELMNEIFNPDISFKGRPGIKACSYCKFASLCGQ